MNREREMLPEPREISRESLLKEHIFLAPKPCIFLDELSSTIIASLMLGVFGWSRMSERRLIGLFAMVLGLVAGLLTLSAAVGPVLTSSAWSPEPACSYGSYLVFRGKTGLLLGGAKARMGAFINIAIGVATLLIPGGLGGTSSILAIASGILGLVAA